MSATAAAPNASRNTFAAIFACRRQVDGLDDEQTWRLFLRQVTGVESLRAMTADQLRQVLDKLHAAGAKRLPAFVGKGVDPRPQAMKLRRLWAALWELGAVRDYSDAALAAFVMSQTGIQALRWNSVTDLNLAIEALKGWCKRLDYLPKPATNLPARSAMHGRWEPSLILAQWDRLIALEAVKHPGARVDSWLERRFGVDHLGLSVPQAQEAVRELGKWLRRVVRGQDGSDG